MVVATACLVPVVRFAVWDDETVLPPAVRPLYAVLAFLGGAWLENLVPAVAAVWFTLLLSAFLRGRKPIPQELIIGLVCWVAGAAVLIAAPGNYERFELVAAELSVWDRIVHVTRRLPGIPNLALLYLLVGFLFVSILSQAHDPAPAIVRSRGVWRSGFVICLHNRSSSGLVTGRTNGFCKRSTF